MNKNSKNLVTGRTHKPISGRGTSNMDEFLLMIKGFQLADKNHAAIPANWPNNELIKDRVIIPPASDV